MIWKSILLEVALQLGLSLIQFYIIMSSVFRLVFQISLNIFLSISTHYKGQFIIAIYEIL